MGEGWGDWHAITALIDTEKDDPDGPRGIYPYVLYEPPRTSPGLRNRPYSRNMEIQPSTYDSIKTNGWLNGASLSQPHGIGHAWAAFLWDMTWDLIEKRGFNPNLYESWSTGGNNLAYQLVNDGLKFQGCAPTFVTGRNAIFAAEEVLTGRRGCLHALGVVLAPRPGLQRQRRRNDEPQRRDRGVRHASGLPAWLQPRLRTSRTGA